MSTVEEALACPASAAASNSPDTAPSLEPIDLFNDLDTLCSLLVAELDAAMTTTQSPGEHVLDAYLLAAGISQIVEDHLHRQAHALDVAERRASGHRMAASSIAAVSKAVSASRYRRRRGPAAWHAGLLEILDSLASIIMAEQPSGSVADAARRLLVTARGQAGSLQRSAASLPRSVRLDVVRLPDCFRSFDQRPEDAHLLAADFAQRWPDREVPLLVVGVRTSGSYLAPLQAAALRATGYHSVGWLTHRPGQPWLASERARFERLRRTGGMAVLTDDPPVTGRKLASSALAIERQGIPHSSVVLLLAVFGCDGTAPDALRNRPLISLPWQRWSFHRLLAHRQLLALLRQQLEGTTIYLPSLRREALVTAALDVRSTTLGPISEPLARPLVRSHLRATYTVALMTDRGASSLEVYVKGTGLGYFGRHSRVLSRRLQGLVPAVYGWADGFLLRQALPESARATSMGVQDDHRAAASVAEYAAARVERARVPADASRVLVRRRAAWEVAGDTLTRGLGPATPAAAPLLRKAVAGILQTRQPCVVDGSPALLHWFDNGRGGLVKADFDERAFSVWDHACYDAGWDVAGAAAHHSIRVAAATAGDGFADLVRAEYQARAQEQISAERWAIYQMLHVSSARAHLVRLLRQGAGQLQAHNGAPPASSALEQHDGFGASLMPWIWACDRALARNYGRFLAELLLADVAVPRFGRLCVLRVEGLLESDSGAGGTLTLAGALTLRALLVHGFRPVLATRDSLHELPSKCADYRAVGAIGEHGLACLDTRSGPVPTTAVPLAAPGDLATGWTNRDESGVAPGFRHIRRVFQVGLGDRLQCPSDLPSIPAGMTPVVGPGYLDVVPTGGDATAARQRLLDGLADGQGVHDAPSGPSIGALLAHKPGGCPTCQPPPMGHQARLLVGALDGGRRDGLARLARLVPSLVVSARREGRPCPTRG